MKKIWITAFMLTIMIIPATAQTPVDALRYSRTNPGGTARFMGLGGAFGALGADFTTASTNPAGIGMFKSSEFSLSPSIFIGSTESIYLGNTGRDQKSNFYLGNLGLVLAKQIQGSSGSSGWKFVQFAVGINRLADYNNRLDISGANTQSSLLDAYAEAGSGIPIEDIEDASGSYVFDLRQAWYTWLLDPHPTLEDHYISTAPSHGVFQSKSIKSSGSMNEFVVSVGANYNDRLYIGGTIGVPFIRYDEYSIYSESDLNPADTMGDPFYFDNFYRIEDLATKGDGFNIKFGLIYRVNDWFRLGAAFHSPTWFTSMKDEWSARMISYWDQGIDEDGNDAFDSGTEIGFYTYDMITPFRVQGSMGFIAGRSGLISAEYEFVDHSMTRFVFEDAAMDQENDVNNAIEDSYRPSHTFRIGTEWRYDVFGFRIGGHYMTSPFRDELNDGSRIGVAGGIGFRTEKFFGDVAYAYTSSKEDYYMYQSESILSPVAANEMNTHSLLLTLGVKF